MGRKKPASAPKPPEPHPSKFYRRTAIDFPDASRLAVDAVKCVSIEGDDIAVVFRSGARSYCLTIGFGRTWHLSHQLNRILKKMSGS